MTSYSDYVNNIYHNVSSNTSDFPSLVKEVLIGFSLSEDGNFVSLTTSFTYPGEEKEQIKRYIIGFSDKKNLVKVRPYYNLHVAKHVLHGMVSCSEKIVISVANTVEVSLKETSYPESQYNRVTLFALATISYISLFKFLHNDSEHISVTRDMEFEKNMNNARNITGFSVTKDLSEDRPQYGFSPVQAHMTEGPFVGDTKIIVPKLWRKFEQKGTNPEIRDSGLVTIGQEQETHEDHAEGKKGNE